MKNIRAFALLEVAIALSVLGIIAYMAMPLMGKLQNWRRTNVTTNHQQQIMEAVAGYVLFNKRLPYSSANINGEATSGVSVGYVPFKTLGIAESVAKDGDHHWMTYAIQPNLASARIVFLQPPELRIDNKCIFCATTADGLFNIHNEKNQPCIKEPDFVAVAIVSHGASGGYYLDNGSTQIVDSTDPHKIANAARLGIFVTKMPTLNDSNIFDDIILFASRSNLMAQWAKSPCIYKH
jgi:type II secretory pathway pseudopilin PulG